LRSREPCLSPLPESTPVQLPAPASCVRQFQAGCWPTPNPPTDPRCIARDWACSLASCAMIRVSARRCGSPPRAPIRNSSSGLHCNVPARTHDAAQTPPRRWISACDDLRCHWQLEMFCLDNLAGRQWTPGVVSARPTQPSLDIGTGMLAASSPKPEEWRVNRGRRD
jgi:hypothetical protein